MTSDPPLTQATRALYGAFAMVTLEPCRRVTEHLQVEDDHVDPFVVEIWAAAELLAVQRWRQAFRSLMMASRSGSEAFEQERRRLLCRAAVYLVSGPSPVPLEDGNDALSALSRAIDLLQTELLEIQVERTRTGRLPGRLGGTQS